MFRFLVLLGCAGALLAADIVPGSVYREYRVTMAGDEWRVTDPNAGHQGAGKFLPNPRIDFEIDDLKGAVRAEVVLDRWGGHPGTSGKQIRFNDNPWLDVPELTTTPEGHQPECYMVQDNPVFPVPVSHLREGQNVLEGTCGDQVCYSFRWGQWGQNAAIVRVYFSSERAHPLGRIVEPAAGAALGENPLVRIEVEDPSAVARVDVLGYYDGFDENGDGIFEDWHHGYFYNRRIAAGGMDPEISGHIGTARGAPFEVVWNTEWVPDHPDGDMRLVARILGKDGTWYVTRIVDGLSLTREDETVRLYKPLDVGEKHWVRAGNSVASKVDIPREDDVSKAVEATLHVRTWNGYREHFGFNDWTGAIAGLDHVYDYTVRRVPVTKLRTGQQLISFYSSTMHHGVEVLWPGPALMVRYSTGEEH